MPSGKVPASLLICEIRGLAELAEAEGVARVRPLLDALPEAAAESVGRAGGRLLALDGERLVFGFGGRTEHPAAGRHAAAAATFLLRRLAAGALAELPTLGARAVVLGLRGTQARAATLGWNAAGTRKLADRALRAAEPGEALLGSELKSDLPPGLPTPRARSAGPSRYLAVAAGGGQPPAADGGDAVKADVGAALAGWRERVAARERLPVAVCVAQTSVAGGVGALREAAARLAAEDSTAEVRDVTGGVALLVGLARRTNDALNRCLRAAVRLRSTAAATEPQIGVASDVVAAAQLAEGGGRQGPLQKPLGKAGALAERAGAGEVRMAAATMAEVEGRFRTTPAAAGTVRVIDVAPDGWRRAWAAAGAPGGAFLGRRSEIRYAEEGLAELAGGKGARYLVLGGPAAGKSALLAEWRRIALARGVRVGVGASGPSAGRMPYGAFREAVADCFDLPLATPPAAAAAAVRARFAALSLDPESPRAAALTALLVGHSPPALRRLSAEIRARLLQESVRTWLAAESAVQPVALMLDDAHLADPATRELLPALALACKPLPVLWVLCGRTGTGQPVLPEVRRIRVNTMTPTDQRELIRQGRGDAPPELLAWAAAAGGLPGPIVDRVREIAAGGPATPALEPIEVPAPVVPPPAPAPDAPPAEAPEGEPAEPEPRPVRLPPPLPARLATLDDEARAVLTAAAVLGPTVPEALLRAAVGRDPARGLARLASLGILVERALAGGATWTFASLYLFEAAAAELPADAVRAAHQAVFKALSKAPSDGPGVLEALVVHGRAAGDPSRVDAQVSAGVAAAAEHHLGAAEDHLREALAQLQEGARRRPEVRFHLAQVLGRRGALDEALEHLARALDELPTPRARRIVRKR